MDENSELRQTAVQLALAFLQSPWRLDALAESGSARLAQWPSWMTALALSVTTAFRAPPTHRVGALVEYIEEFLREHAATPLETPPEPELPPPRPGPRQKRRRPTWPVVEIDSVAALAERLELSPGQLDWLADVKSLERTVTSERLRNYRYALVRRRSGIPRVIEAPKARLKEVQRWILREVLDPIPNHATAHGFTRDRSILSNAEPHVAQAAVLRLDLKDFFASVAARRVFGIFSAAGYSCRVAHALTGLCTNAVPVSVWAVVPPAPDPRTVQQRFWLGRQLATPHLPQGAPTSPALANLAAFRLDRRLNGLAESLGFGYSRYADDLTFSGPDELRRRRDSFESLVAEITAEEGFALNSGKSRLHTAGSRQSVCGVVVNVRPNVLRSEYDQLRAILHNAVRYGPATQNRAGVGDFAAHLRGRIAWVNSLNPSRGEKLLRRFADVDWSD